MNNITFNCVYAKFGGILEKRCIVNFNSDTIKDIKIFDSKHYDTSIYISGNHISLNGISNICIIKGSNWTDIENVRNDLVTEIQNKWSTLKNNINFDNISLVNTNEIILN